MWLHGEDAGKLADGDNTLKDYKFYCFNGEPKYLYVSDRMDDHENARLSFVDMNYEMAPFGRTDYKEFETLPAKPEHFEKMKKIAETLAKGMPFLRVDLYEINHRIYFGELTFYPCAGFMPFKPKGWDEKLGKLVQLPNNGVR